VHSLAVEPTKPGWVERKFTGWVPCSLTRLRPDEVGLEEHPPETTATNIPKRIGQRGRIASHPLFPVLLRLKESFIRNIYPPGAVRCRVPHSISLFFLE
jgi:hypothetical protein